MPQLTPAQHSSADTRNVNAFFDAIAESNGDARAVMDSIRNTSEVQVPKQLGELLGRVSSADEKRIFDSINLGVAEYTKQHGVAPTADVIEAAIQQGNVASRHLTHDGQVLDSLPATSDFHSQEAIQGNRAVVAIVSAIAEAIPFANTLPYDLGSNKATLAIVNTEAGEASGDYAKGEIMDGINSGDVFTQSSRFVKFDITGSAPFTGKFSDRNLTGANAGYCDPSATGVPVLRGRTVVYVNGRVAAQDAFNGSGATSPISGSVAIAGTTYTIAGTVTVATGAVSLTSISPTLPVGTLVTAQGFIDYESAPGLIATVITRATTWDLFASPNRVMTRLSIDAQGQFRNELGLDARSIAMMSARTQMANERFYLALKMARDLGISNTHSFDFNYAQQMDLKTRSQVWQDFAPVLFDASQKMVNDTMDHGITHLFVSGWVAGQFMGLGRDLFVPSGVQKRAAPYRVGRLFDEYEVYYSPKIVEQSTDLASSSIIAVGRSTQPARCPIVTGDAIPPTMLELSTGSDLKQQAAMYSRTFTAVNPHDPSALGCARINITNLK